MSSRRSRPGGWRGWPTCAVALAGLAWGAVAEARLNCNFRDSDEIDRNTYLMMVIVEPVALRDASRSDQARERLRSTFRGHVRDLSRQLHQRAGANGPRLSLELVACEHVVDGDDLGPSEMRELAGAKVVAVLWRGQEGGKPGLMQLAVPIYLRAGGDAGRSEYEVVTAYQSNAGNPIERWREILAWNDGELYRPFVSMGLAVAYRREKALVPAWLALCDSRSGLEGLSHGTMLRPKAAEFAQAIEQPLAQEMAMLEQEARQAGRQAMPPCKLAAR